MHRGCGTDQELTQKQLSGFIVQLGVFDNHVLELTGFEDVDTLEAFDEFGVFLAGHNLHTRVLTLIHDASLLGGIATAGLKS
jgi:hypothetical protein